MIRRPRTRLLLASAILIGLLGGCGGGGARAAGQQAVRVAPDLVGAVSGAVGKGARGVEIPSGSIDDLARRTQVAPEAIVDAAGSAGRTSVWRGSLDRLQRLDEGTKGPVRDAAVDSACEVLDGKTVTEQDFLEHLQENGVTRLTRQQFRALVEDTNELISGLRDASRSPDQGERAAVVILCFTVKATG